MSYSTTEICEGIVGYEAEMSGEPILVITDEGMYFFDFDRDEEEALRVFLNKRKEQHDLERSPTGRLQR
jgi:hypothetical protein